mmetsp:Transcript_5888/g.8617  ORF Transcript_5888/g.8617 Transcript_5888/m.8617 type:complete len:242 (-) Transcript_5888:20-745(-)
MQKTLLRKGMRKMLRNYAKQEDEVRKESMILSRQFKEKMKEWKTVKNICLYYPMRTEPQIVPLIKDLLKTKNQKIYLPVIENEQKREMNFYRIYTEEDLKEFKPSKTYKNIYQPTQIEQREKFSGFKNQEETIMVVPGIAFNEKGERLGQGGGYYDTFLKEMNENTKFVGLSFKNQMVNEIPMDQHDQKLDMVITTKHIYEINKKGFIQSPMRLPQQRTGFMFATGNTRAMAPPMAPENAL